MRNSYYIYCFANFRKASLHMSNDNPKNTPSRVFSYTSNGKFSPTQRTTSRGDLSSQSNIIHIT